MIHKECNLFIPIFEDDYCIVFTSDIQNSIQKLSKKYKVAGEPPDATYARAMFIPLREFKDLKHVGWVLFDLKYYNPQVVAHEGLHATSNTLRHRGIPHTKKTEEVYTYLQEFICKEIYTLYKKFKAK